MLNLDYTGVEMIAQSLAQRPYHIPKLCIPEFFTVVFHNGEVNWLRILLVKT